MQAGFDTQSEYCLFIVSELQDKCVQVVEKYEAELRNCLIEQKNRIMKYEVDLEKSNSLLVSTVNSYCNQHPVLDIFVC